LVGAITFWLKIILQISLGTVCRKINWCCLDFCFHESN